MHTHKIHMYLHVYKYACCSVLPTAPELRAVYRRCQHTPSCLSLSTPTRPYLDDSGMPEMGCH